MSTQIPRTEKNTISYGFEKIPQKVTPKLQTTVDKAFTKTMETLQTSSVIANSPLVILYDQLPNDLKTKTVDDGLKTSSPTVKMLSILTWFSTPKISAVFQAIVNSCLRHEPRNTQNPNIRLFQEELRQVELKKQKMTPLPSITDEEEVIYLNKTISISGTSYSKPEDIQREKNLIMLFNKLPDNLKPDSLIKRLQEDKDDTSKALRIKIWLEKAASHEELRSISNIDLSNSDITELPEEISLFNKLKILNISNSLISSLPPHMGILRKLRILDISNTNIIISKELLRALENLKSFSARECSFEASIEDLKLLKNAEIISLPQEIAQQLATLISENFPSYESLIKKWRQSDNKQLLYALYEGNPEIALAISCLPRSEKNSRITRLAEDLTSSYLLLEPAHSPSIDVLDSKLFDKKPFPFRDITNRQLVPVGQFKKPTLIRYKVTPKLELSDISETKITKTAQSITTTKTSKPHWYHSLISLIVIMLALIFIHIPI
jgi:Leucine-rich repeat (LRR) protein